jgi:hypothetical protein
MRPREKERGEGRGEERGRGGAAGWLPEEGPERGEVEELPTALLTIPLTLRVPTLLAIVTTVQCIYPTPIPDTSAQ